MWPIKQFLFLLLAVMVRDSIAQSVVSFPAPDTILSDVKHKEPKSGVQLGAGNTLTIQSGVGTPTTINVIAFSKDSKLPAAGKDFGRVVVWDLVGRCRRNIRAMHPPPKPVHRLPFPFELHHDVFCIEFNIV